jgi:hypothetical protein
MTRIIDPEKQDVAANSGPGVDTFLKQIARNETNSPARTFRPAETSFAETKNLSPDKDHRIRLRRYPTRQLEGRLSYCDREALYNPNPKARAQFKREAEQTRRELSRRAMEEAEKVVPRAAE